MTASRSIESEVAFAAKALRDALCRDRAHLVLVGDRPVLSRAPRQLAAEIEPAVQTIVLRLERRSAEDVAPLLLAALGWRGDVNPELRLSTALAEVSNAGGAVAVVLPNAMSLSTSTLKRIGSLAAGSRECLRLALLVERNGSVPETMGLVEALGVGAEKVVLAPAALSTTESLRPVPFAPVLDARTIRIGRPTTARERRIRRRMVSIAVALAALAAVPILWSQDGAPSGFRGPPQFSELWARQPVAATAELAGEPVLYAKNEVSTPREEPAEAPPLAAPPAEPPESAPTPEPEPTPVPLAQLSVNARPWARIDIDGREVGITPLGDLRLAIGEHVLAARFPDGRLVERRIRVGLHGSHIRID